ncbi:hypothetical protein ACFY8P_04485 [Streptomyces sp. NPDC012693]|uniref:hypothetical protein n=1 Tax=Streptomyces sp. NPDC012693 TaxID=3364844 RepID=UPI00369AE5C2
MTQPTRQSAYDAVYAYIRTLPVSFLPTTVVDRNAIIWRAVNAALDAERAAALREAADAIDARQAKLDAEIRAEYGELDLTTELEGAATRSMAAHLRRMAEEARS